MTAASDDTATRVRLLIEQHMLDVTPRATYNPASVRVNAATLGEVFASMLDQARAEALEEAAMVALEDNERTPGAWPPLSAPSKEAPMPGDVLKFPRGTAIAFTTGEYSDYCLDATVVTIRDCDLAALAQQFNEEERAAIKARGGEDWEVPAPSEFASWLIAKGHAMPAEMQIVHLGSYSSFEPEFGVKDTNHG